MCDSEQREHLEVMVKHLTLGVRLNHKLHDLLDHLRRVVHAAANARQSDNCALPQILVLYLSDRYAEAHTCALNYAAQNLTLLL